jgi:hypothetical protein
MLAGRGLAGAAMGGLGSDSASMDQGGTGHGRCTELECGLGVEPAPWAARRPAGSLATR